MANAVMNKWKEAIESGSSNSAVTGTLKFVLCRSAVNTFAQTQQFVSDLTSPHATKSDALTSVTDTNGVVTAANGKFTAPASDGNTYNQLYLVIDTGTGSTSRLIAFYDTGVTGLPVTPNGADINFTVNGSGLFTL